MKTKEKKRAVVYSHTPGPWRIEMLNPLEIAITKKREAEETLRIAKVGYPGSNHEFVANGALLAAAPELLAACRAAVEAIDGGHGYVLVLKQLHTAIDKATF